MANFPPKSAPRRSIPAPPEAGSRFSSGKPTSKLTFHEGDKKTINGLDCVMVEPDIDYYKDLAAHALLEVVTNKLTDSLTDPRQVYVLRWIAGRHAGVPNFEPPYTLE